MNDPTKLEWYKSSFSSANGQSVVCARLVDGGMAIKDSKLANGSPILVFNQDEWEAFMSGAKLGEFDVT